MQHRALTSRPTMRRKLSTATPVGMRLRRGYGPPAANAMEVDLRREEADDFAARVPVDKLVFVVHGIGQVKGASVSYRQVSGDLVACLPIVKHSMAYGIVCMDPHRQEKHAIAEQFSVRSRLQAQLTLTCCCFCIGLIGSLRGLWTARHQQ